MSQSSASDVDSKNKLNESQSQKDEKQLLALIPRDLPTNISEALSNQIEEIQKRTITFIELQKNVQKLNSSDIVEMHYALALFRRFISTENQRIIYKIQLMLDLKILQYLNHIVNIYSQPLILFQVGWIITNIVSGSKMQTQQFLTNDGINMASKVLKCETLSVKEQAASTFGNLAAENDKIRDQLIKLGIIDQIIQLNMEFYLTNFNFSEVSVWALSNFFINREIPESEDITLSVKIFSEIIKNSEDRNILQEACLGLISMSQDQRGIKLIIEANIVPKLVLLLTRNNKLAYSAMTIIRDILTGNEEQIDYILLQPIDYLQLLQQKDPLFKLLAFESLIEICDGSIKQMHQIIYNEKLINYLFLLFNKGKLFAGLLWIFSNALSTCSQNDTAYLVEKGLIKGLAKQLELFDSDNDYDDQLSFLLLGIDRILEQGEELKNENKTNPYAEKFRLEKNFIQNLSKDLSDSFAIQSKIDDIKKYFDI